MSGFVLSVPEKRVSAWFAETDLRYARAWLEALPLADTAESAREVYRALYTLNRQDLDPQQRFDLMELYGPVVDLLCGGLQSHFAHLAFPLAPKKRQLADFIRQIHMEMAFGYKACLHGLTRVRMPWTRKHLALSASERATRHLGEVLWRSYHVYLPYPAEVWREIHTLFRHALVNGRDNEPLNGARGRDATQTIRSGYLQIVLLGLTGPYQLGHGECIHIRQFLSRWAERAQLQSDLNVGNPVGHFLVDLSADAPPAPFPRAVHLSAADHLLALNTVELVRQVHGFAARLQRGESAQALGLGVDCLDAACLDLMRRLVRAWAFAPRRQHSRLKRQGSVSLCAGLGALHFFVNGQRPFHVPRGIAASRGDDEVASLPDLGEARATNGEGDADEVYIALDDPGAVNASESPSGNAPMGSVPPTADVYRADRWQVRDVGPRGLLLARTGEALSHVRVGDPLGIQRSGDLTHWSVGVVRWMKSSDPASLELGVELLAPHARAVALWLANGPSVRETQMFALSLPAIEAMHRPASLLVARGVFQPDREYFLFDGDGPPQRVRLLKQLERTSAFEQVVFAAAAEPAANAD